MVNGAKLLASFLVFVLVGSFINLHELRERKASKLVRKNGSFFV